MPINGKKIRELRTSKKLSQFGLALEIDVSKGTIEHIEKGRYDGKHNGQTVVTLERLAKFFGVKTDDILCNEN